MCKHRHAWASTGKLGQISPSKGKLGQVGASLYAFCSLFMWVEQTVWITQMKWTKRVRLTSRKLMAHHQNQNGFTCKKTKQTACIIVQYRCVITMDLKVNAAAGNMWTPSTLGSFSLTKNPTFEVPKNLPMMIHRVESQNNQPEYCLHFQFPAKLANYSRNGWLDMVGGCKKDRTAQQIVKRCFKYRKFCVKTRRNWVLKCWILVCAHIACCSSLSTTYKMNASSDTVVDWATLMRSPN